MTTTPPLNLPRTILGSLTTTFTPPAECGYIAIPTTSWGGSRAYHGQGCSSDNQFGQADATSCWPTTTWPAPSPTVPLGRWGFYSPGIVCPSGYTTAVVATAGGVATWPVPFLPVEGETAAGCCPTGFTWIYVPDGTNVGGVSCASTTTSTVVTLATCDAGGTMVEDGSVVTYPYVTAVTLAETTATSTTQSTMSSLIVWAPMVHIYWQSTDRETASTSETSLSTASQTANAENSSPTAAISTGAIAGMVVGCVIAVFAVGAVAFFLMRRRRQRGNSETLGGAKGVDQAATYHQQQQGQQLQHLSDPSELDSLTKPSELHGTRTIHEMDGEYHRRD